MKVDLQENCSIRCGLELGRMYEKTVYREREVIPAEVPHFRGDNSRYQDFLQRIIKIRTEYDEKYVLIGIGIRNGEFSNVSERFKHPLSLLRDFVATFVVNNTPISRS